MQPEKLALREHPDIVVTTPSRLIEHLKANNISIKTLQFVVVDEADLILTYGYNDDIRGIIEHLPRVCQGFLMSATLNPDVDSLKQLVLHTPAVLKLSEAVQKKQVLKEYSITCSDNDKYLIAYVMIRLNLLPGKTLFFTNSIDRGYRFRLFLERFSLKAAVLNSELPHKSRQHILKEFNQGVFDYLIAVDDALPTSAAGKKGKKNEAAEEEEEAEGDNDDGEGAVSDKRKRKVTKDSEFGVSRGVDFKGVKAVINFDFPLSASSYMHRIGRTARGGDVGMALSFVTPEDEEMLEEVKERQAADSKEVVPYNFKMSLVDGFRYRVEDVLRSVTSLQVKDARINEIRSEILNSEKLKAHFEDNPRDLQLLQHDRPLSKEKGAEHLKHIPFYIMPSSRPATAKRPRPERPQVKGKKARADDPLRSFSYDGNKTSRPAAAASVAGSKNENEINLGAEEGGDNNEDAGGDAVERSAKAQAAGERDEEMSDANSEELADMRKSYGLAYGKKVMKERKLKYIRGPGKKKVADRIKEQLKRGEN